MNPDYELEELLERLRRSRKYQFLPEETLRDLLSIELRRQPKPALALKAARAKLHNILADYLGDLDYPSAARELQAACSAADPEALPQLCRSFLQQHHSTRERLPYLSEFYQGIFSVCGQPDCVLDLACGLNPFALPWMGLPASVRYYAYDIHPARVALINQFLACSGRQPLAEVRDILLRPPQIRAEASFLFKEAHRLEKRRAGCNRGLWAALPVRFLFVSLPQRSLDGRRDLRERMQRLVAAGTQGMPWQCGQVAFAGETVFWIDKGAQPPQP